MPPFPHVMICAGETHTAKQVFIVHDWHDAFSSYAVHVCLICLRTLRHTACFTQHQQPCQYQSTCVPGVDSYRRFTDVQNGSGALCGCYPTTILRLCGGIDSDQQQLCSEEYWQIASAAVSPECTQGSLSVSAASLTWARMVKKGMPHLFLKLVS